MRKQQPIILLLHVAALVGVAAAAPTAQDYNCDFRDTPMPVFADRRINPQIDPAQEKYFVELPPNYDGAAPFGLVVYITPEDQINQVPPGWGRILAKERLLFVAAENSGNDQIVDRRVGLALLAASAMQRHYKIDANRIYAAGLSGGARMAGFLGVFAGDVFHGTIQSCGVDFYKPLPQVQATTELDNTGKPYGLLLSAATTDEIDAAKKRVRFVFITGSRDFRVGNIHDIDHGGYEKEQFQAKLIDVPGMPHQDCPPRVLLQALDFIEGTNNSAATSQPAAPAWMSKDYALWPQILLMNDAQLSDRTCIYGASAFLMRLPNGAVVGATARHLLGGATLADLTAKWRSWALVRKNVPGSGVSFTGVAEKSPDGDALDWLVMTPRSQSGSWPALPLPARTEPLEVGDTVYVLAVPNGDSSRQNVYKGTVTQEGDHGEFFYQTEQSPDSRGFSGAPIIDSSGELAGVHFGHTDKPDIFVGTETAAVLDLIHSPTPIAASQTHAAPPDDPADHELRVAKLMIDNQAYDTAKAKLQDIIDHYPKTPAAAQAKKLLSDLQNQNQNP